jgi:hypothetical protein
MRDFAVWRRQLGEAGRAFLRRLPDHGVTRQELSRGSWLPVREGYVLARCTCLIRAEGSRIRPGPGLFAAWLAAHDTTSQPTHEWDLAISYASEDEKLAAAIHNGLRSRFRVFFAADQEAYLWGEQLGDALPKLYGERSRFVLVISSACAVPKLDARPWPGVSWCLARLLAGTR